MRKRSKVLLVCLIALIVAQVVPLPRTNPAITGDVGAPADVAKLLRAACYDCHSNETVWPWYAWVAPVSWLVVWDVHRGRKHLNFSEWAHLTDAERRDAFKEIAEEVQEREMPMAIYPPLHPEARLTDAQRSTIVAWAQHQAGSTEGVTGTESDHPGLHDGDD